jgi:hypothetical protein
VTRAYATSGSFLALASRFSKRSGSRESIQPARRQMCLQHEVSLLTLCPLGQPKKAIGHEPQIEPWLTHDSASISLACVSEIDLEFRILLSLFLDPLRTVLAVKVSQAAPIGAPLTAPGRSEQHIPHNRESKDQRPATGQGNMINVPRLYSQRIGEAGGAGLDAEISLGFSSMGRYFS